MGKLLSDSPFNTATIGLGRKKVYKYSFDVESKTEYEVLLPRKSQILSIQEQHGKVVMWYAFAHEDETNLTRRKFKFIVTGYETVSIVAVHLATLQFNEGNFVLHLFEE